MAQTISEIQDEVIAEKDAQPALAELNSPSKVSIWRLFTYVFSASAWTLQKRQDLHKAEVLAMIQNERVHYLTWYEELAKSFQYGHPLIPDSDQYDNTGLSESDIEDARVIKYAAAQEVYNTDENLKGVRLKLATIVDGDLAPVPDAQMAAFKAYINKVKDAGVKIYESTSAADSLKLEVTIYYDPLVLDADGKRLDGTNDTPVQEAINNFLLTGLVFNGVFITALLTDAIQAVEGVVIPHIESVEARHGILPYEPIPVKYQPDSGYLRIIDPNTDLIINWEAYA